MALITPILLDVMPFDATKEAKIKFFVNSGDQVVKNRLIIRNNSDNSIIYDNTNITFNFEHTLSLNTLTNGIQYNAQVSTFNANNQESSLSNIILFYCYSTPVISITNIINGTINNSTYEFQGSYFQAQGELLESYIFYLYDNNDELINSGVIKYDDDLKQTFLGFKEDTQYGVEFKVKTIYGIEISTGIVRFSVNYITPNLPAIIHLENFKDRGFIKVSGSFIYIQGKTSNTPVYLNSDFIDLTNGDSLIFDEGFSLEGDFTKKLFFQRPSNRKTIFSYNNQSDPTQNIKLIYSYNKVELYQQNGNYTYYTYSNTIDSANIQSILDIEQLSINEIDGLPITRLESDFSDLLFLWLQRKNGLISLKLSIMV